MGHAVPALAVAATLMFIVRPLAVFLCLAPFRFSGREKNFISWVGLRGAVGNFLAAIPSLVGMTNAQIFFDIGSVVVLVSLPGAGLDDRARRPSAAHRAAGQRSGAAARRT